MAVHPLPAVNVVKQNVRTAHGTIHSATIGRTFKLHGYPQTNRAGVAAGKADCGALTSTAAEVVPAHSHPVSCPKCLA